MSDPMTQLMPSVDHGSAVVTGARTGRHHWRLSDQWPCIHTRSTRCVMWTVSQSLSEEAADADLTAATVSVA